VSARLTPARRRGLEVLARWGYVRESNVTDLERGLVYWQTVNWLVGGYYAVVRGGPAGSRVIALTRQGRLLAIDQGLAVRRTSEARLR
jgi:hypothetical protein